jgi:ABC-type nitrate/sulfonate/bicarbonate transport system ATPase subunit
MLDLSDLRVTFNAGTPSEVRALSGLSLAIAPGDFVTVIGANGAGKSTLFNVIAGNRRAWSNPFTRQEHHPVAGTQAICADRARISESRARHLPRADGA